MRTRLAVVCLAAFLAPAAVARADDPGAVSEVVVTASHFAQPATRLTADTTALGADDAPTGATLGELLATTSDLEVQQPGGPAGVGSIFLRGAKPNFTLVMIDGVPLGDQTNSRGGSTDVSALNLLDVGRVEIVRGALSSVYGSGAIEGAVNLILPGGAPQPTASAAIEGATDRGAAGALQLRGPLGGAAGGSVSADWDDAGRDTLQSSRVNESLGARVAPLDGSDSYDLTLRLSRSAAAAFPDDSGGPRLAVLRQVERTVAEQALIGGDWRIPLSGGLSLELNGTATASRFDDTTPGVAPAGFNPGVPSGTSRDTYDFARGQVILRATLSDAWRALAGVEAQQETGHDRSNLTFLGLAFPSRYDLHRTTLAAFAESDADFGPLALDASVRVDRPDRLGGHLTGRVGAAYRLGGSLTLHGDWGESFKAPSFFSLGNAFVGNPALRPETAQTGEAGVTWAALPGVKLEANVFRTQYRQLIDFVPGPPPRLENRSSVLSQGVQATLGAALTDRGELTLSATYVDTRDQTTGERLLDLPRWRITAALDWRLSHRVRLRLESLSVGDRLDTSVPTGNVTLAPYTTLNARLFFELGRATDLEASLENALDQRYEAAVGFPSPGVIGRIAIKRLM